MAGSLVRERVLAAWTVLIAATVVSWCLGTGHGISLPVAASIVVLIVAFVKVRIIGGYFMELRDAPTGLKVIFDAYCLVMCAVLIGVFLWL